MISSITLRNATFKSLQAELEGRRLEAWLAWNSFGPGTTRTIAGRAGIDLLVFRPRTTELLQLGLLSLIDKVHHEGVYKVVSVEDWSAWRAAALSSQLLLL